MRYMDTETGRHSFHRIILPAAFILSAVLLLCAARRLDGFAQWYSVTIYPLIVGSAGRLFGLLPFSLSEILCSVLPLLIIADAVRLMIHASRRGDRKLTAVKIFLQHVFTLASVLLLLYAANCGVNYYREPFVPAEKLESSEVSEEGLVSFCDYTAEKLQDCYSAEAAEPPAYPEGKALREKAVYSMENLSETYTELRGTYPAPKHLTYMSRLFSMMGVSGIYSPFTVEANVNGEMPGLEQPFTSCHELSHLRGYMNEGEANYIGWLACIGSDDDAFQRSGWLIAWSYAGSALRQTDPDAFTSVYEKLPDGAIRELEDNYLFWHEHENQASQVQDKVNDAYLKTNGQSSGIQTYGQVTDLMLMWYSDQDSSK